jgi:DNA-binding transcriptional MerR regulator/methylmalonyl-CoA mutase cobalamin-binding subunit
MPNSDKDLSAPRFPIRIAARRAGVSIDALRAWERRYNAVSPARTSGEQRLYSEADVERLVILRELTDAGHSISALAGVSSDELRRLRTSVRDAGGREGDGEPSPAAVATVSSDAPHVLRTCHRAVRAHDSEAVYRVLQREAFRLTTLGFLEEIATPFMARVGDEWAAGQLSEAQERLASGALRRVLGVVLQYLRIDDRDRDPSTPAPLRVMTTTLAGERHELGALMAAAVAADLGCDVNYPGADLPGPALAAAARRSRAEIVALSLLDGSAPRLAQRELSAVRDLLPARTRIVVGGASAALLDDVLEPLGAERVDSLREWSELLVERIAPARGRAPA